MGRERIKLTFILPLLSLLWYTLIQMVALTDNQDEKQNDNATLPGSLTVGSPVAPIDPVTSSGRAKVKLVRNQ